MLTLLAFGLGVLVTWLFSQKPRGCWTCTRAAHCAQLPDEDTPDV